MKYDPKPAEQVSAVNILKNGSFEMEGTELSGWRGKGHWSGWGHVHSGKNTPEMKALKAKFSKTAFRKVSTAQAYKGKYSAFIKTPDEVRDVAENDPLLEKAFKIIKQHRTAKKTPVRLAAPWTKSCLEFTFPAALHSIVVWDNARQQLPTFEPVFKRTQIAPGKSAEFIMSTSVK